MKSLLRIAPLCMSFSTSLSLAQPDSMGTLTLEKVLTMIETHYPPMLAASLERDIARGEHLAAEGGFDLNARGFGSWKPLGFYQYDRVDTLLEQPTTLWGTSLYGGWRLGNGNFPSYYGAEDTGSLGEVRGGVKVPILKDGATDRRRANLKRAAIGTQVAEHLVAQRLLELRRAATRAYWAWVIAGERLRINKALLNIAEMRDSGIATRVRAGDLPAIEHTDNQRTVMERRARLIDARRRLEQAANELSLWVRDGSGKPLMLRDDQLPKKLPDLSHDSLYHHPTPTSLFPSAYRMALKRRPEVARFLKSLEQLDIELKWTENQVLPRLDAMAGVSKDMGIVDPTRAPTEVDISFVLEVPLQLRAARGKAEVTKAQRERLALDQKFLKERISADVRDALIALEAAQKRIVVAQQAARLAETLEKAEQANFDLGNSTILVVNLREQASVDAQLVVAEALGDYLNARADYNYATGEKR